MSHRRSPRGLLPQPDAEVLNARLASLRGALGADRVGVARRLTLVSPPDDPPAFEVLAAVGEVEPFPVPERATPMAAYQQLLEHGRALEQGVDGEGSIARWLRAHAARRLLGWPLPSDRLPCVFLVAVYRSDRDPGAQRLRVAREGMEALARALAPPAWLPLSSARSANGAHVLARRDPNRANFPRPPSDEVEALDRLLPLEEAVVLVEKLMIRRALQCSEGNKAAAARTLRMSRQSLYKKLKRYGLL